MVAAIVELRRKVRQLTSDVAKLKKDSHPPVTFEECDLCSALVVMGRMENHKWWHRKQDRQHLLGPGPIA